jgi:hypothetical protein
MRSVSILKFAVVAAILAVSSASAMAGGWGHGGLGYGRGWGYGGLGYGSGYGCGCGGCGCGGSVAVASYVPVTTYVPYTVYRPTTAYVASYATVPYEQAYVVEQGPYYRPAVTGYRTASYTYDEPRAYPYVGGYRYRHGYGARRHVGWRGYNRVHHGGPRIIKRPMPPIGYK